MRGGDASCAANGVFGGVGWEDFCLGRVRGARHGLALFRRKALGANAVRAGQDAAAAPTDPFRCRSAAGRDGFGAGFYPLGSVLEDEGAEDGAAELGEDVDELLVVPPVTVEADYCAAA